MQKSSYSIQKFSENFSQKTSISEIIKLVKTNSNVDLAVDFVSKGLTFDFRSDAFVGESHAIILPKLHINGELYQASGWHNLTIPLNGFAGLEHSFLTALKSSISTMQRIYNVGE